MAKAEWGLKRVCPGCNARYYDMKKNPPVCPSCGVVYDPENLLRTRRGRGVADKRASVAAAVAPEEELEDIPVAEGDEPDDAVIEDAEELGEEVVDEVVGVEEE